MVTTRTRQGDILNVEGIAHPVIVVSNDFFNRSGKVIACPIVKKAAEGPLHIPARDLPVGGLVLCEQVRYLDLEVRRFSKIATAHPLDIMDISDAIASIFEHQ